MKLFTLPILLIVLSSIASTAQGVDISEAEFQKMPRFCHAKIRDKSKAAEERWTRIIGKVGWLHVHHFCFALKHEMLVRARDAGDPKASAFARRPVPVAPEEWQCRIVTARRSAFNRRPARPLPAASKNP